MDLNRSFSIGFKMGTELRSSPKIIISLNNLGVFKKNRFAVIKTENTMIGIVRSVKMLFK
jgi:hypothetical protein